MSSKALRVALCIALCLCLFTGTFAIMGWGDQLRGVGESILYPFRWVAGKATDAIDGFSAYFRDIEEMEKENESLKDEIESLRAELLDAEIIRDEDEWLYRYLSMKEERTDWSLLSAYVTATEWEAGADGKSYAVALTLNKGSASGLEVGMPVVTDLGLVGLVTEVSKNTCRVRTLLDTDFAAGALLPRSGETGLVEGSFSTLPDGQAALTALPAESGAAVGDIVLTSGRGGVYPYGIPIGRVESVEIDPLSRTSRATVSPIVDMTSIRQVSVLTAYEQGTGVADPSESTAPEVSP